MTRYKKRSPVLTDSGPETWFLTIRHDGSYFITTDLTDDVMEFEGPMIWDEYACNTWERIA